MNFMKWEDLFGRATGKRNPRRTLKNATWQTLTGDTWFDGIEYAAGSRYKYWEGENFGFVCFDSNSRTPQGHIPGRFIHRN